MVDVAVTDPELLGAARFAGRLNLVLLSAVLAFLVHSGARAEVEVVAPALTLFAAVQAGPHAASGPDHAARPAVGDRLPAVIASMLPTVILAAALAFVPPGDGAVTWAAASRSPAQLAVQQALRHGP